jgi:hypothetical protein
VAGGVLYATVQHATMAVLDPTTGSDIDVDSLYDGAIDHAVIVNAHLYVTTGRLLDAYTP